MSTPGLLFQWASTIKIKLSVLFYKVRLTITPPMRSQSYKFDLKNDHVIIVCVLQVQVN
jgi:hypothetical protein